MPKGPKGEKRPADTVSNAVLIGRIATGEVEETRPPKKSGPTASEMGQKGGAARAKSMTPERRAEIAKKAAESRWRHKGDTNGN